MQNVIDSGKKILVEWAVTRESPNQRTYGRRETRVMETKSRRFVLNLPEELEEEIQMTKEQFFHDTSYSEMYRQLIRAGLETLKVKKEREGR